MILCLMCFWDLFDEFLFFWWVGRIILFLFPPTIPIANSFGSLPWLLPNTGVENTVILQLFNFSYGEISKCLFRKWSGVKRGHKTQNLSIWNIINIYYDVNQSDIETTEKIILIKWFTQTTFDVCFHIKELSW